MDIRSTKIPRTATDKTSIRRSKYRVRRIGNYNIEAIKHMGKLSLKIETITDQVENMILEYKKINITSSQISAEEASYNRGAVDALTKVLKMLKKDCNDFS
tara:strand:+ start:38 stop:340 length:303 start_codon:yes stop_codon:yes gene_type:complete